MQALRLTILLPLLALGALLAKPLITPKPEARRLEILFFGAPTKNGAHHDPISRYRSIKKELGSQGIDFTYSEDPAEAFNPGTLAKYDGVLMYGNWEMNGKMPDDQLKALTDYVNNGGAFLPIHCASACYGGSPEFINLVGGRFKEHQTGTFKVTNVNRNHPIMRGYDGFEAWDETYVHDRLTDDRELLEKRDQEPWTWVRQQGKGRVFYTAAGHDHRVWDNDQFAMLIRNAIYWSVGPDKYKLLQNLKLPKLEMEDAKLPGYIQHELITKAQKPLSPEESMKMAQVPEGFELSLFASEPDIVNPIFVNWDHKGRAYIIQTVDYPNNLHSGNLGNDKIILAEDTDKDGRADKFTTFADKLSIPTSLVCVNGGVICTNCSEILFLKDTNGDDKADVRQVLFSGFGVGDTHAGVSNLRYGHDNWIYATVGYSGFKGDVGGEHFDFAQQVFRFKPDGSKLEVIQGTTNNTWGLGTTSDFDMMGSTANGNPSFYVTHARKDYQSAGLNQGRTPRADNNPAFFPSSMDIRQVDQFDPWTEAAGLRNHYTAGAGHAFYTAERFPEPWREKVAFITEGTGKLVGAFEVKREGAGYKSYQLANNIYNSADAWSGPVCAETGPDGALWICDWYNLIIQHNPTPTLRSAGLDSKTGKGNAYETPLRDTQYGRVYRVYPKGSPDDADPNLDPTKGESLIAGLNHPNLFWRLQAQRLIVESGNKAYVPKLEELLAGRDHAATHAVYALAGLGALQDADVAAALSSGVRGSIRAAIHMGTPKQLRDVLVANGKIGLQDPRDLAEAIVAMSAGDTDVDLGKTLFALLQSDESKITSDASLKDGWQIAANRQAAGVLLAAATAGVGGDEAASKSPNLIKNGDFSEVSGGKPTGWTDHRFYGGDRDGVKLTASPDGREGSMALSISSEKNSDNGAAVTIPVKKRTSYLLSAWVKTKDLKPAGNGPGAMLNVHGGEMTKGVKGTSDWTQVSVNVDSGDRDELLIHCLFGGYGGATGTAWWDDVSLTEVAGGAGIGGMLNQVAARFATTADPAAKQALADELAKLNTGYAKKLLADMNAKPAAPTVQKEKKNKIDPAVHERGKAIYNMTCIACHQPEGQGLVNAFPPLDGSDWLTGDPSVPIRIVIAGLQGPVKVNGQDFNSIMPPVAEMDDQKIADVLTLVRQSWSNDATPVTPAQVKEVRAKYESHPGMWTAKELGH
ncbi:PVC-type heme-binding CxxCH protein [Haloferula sp. BvORR071]|uniref:PVC-type heme-binding CxxCH protein n=1 Tax=Haloferula sp. BvORR071 TaxID=1396141 RepID=UPI00069694CA|nr:PVC-type heme-binding CxxCH protein [Haloferula sp. BvORR071]